MIEILLAIIALIIVIFGVAQIRGDKRGEMSHGDVAYNANTLEAELNDVGGAKNPRDFLYNLKSFLERGRGYRSLFEDTLRRIGEYKDSILQEFYRNYVEPFNTEVLRPLFEYEMRIESALGEVEMADGLYGLIRREKMTLEQAQSYVQRILGLYREKRELARISVGVT